MIYFRNAARIVRAVAGLSRGEKDTPDPGLAPWDGAELSRLARVGELFDEYKMMDIADRLRPENADLAGYVDDLLHAARTGK